MCSFPPGCVIICFTVSHVDSDGANKLWLNREKQEGEMEGGEQTWEDGERDVSDGGVEKWKHIVFICELSQQQWIKLAGCSISSVTHQLSTVLQKI